MNNSKEIAAFKKKIHKFLLETMYLNKNGELDNDHNRYTDQEGFDSKKPEELSIEMLKYYLENLPTEFKNILYSSDAKIIKEPDVQDGFYFVYAKSLDNKNIPSSFSFSYGSDEAEDFTVFMPGEL